MKVGKVTKARFNTNPPICEKCGNKVKIGEEFYFASQSKKKYCKPCGDKMYQ